MRISTEQFHAQSFNSINLHQKSILDVQERLTSGVRVNRPSDDPSAIAQINGLKKMMHAIAQHEKNGQFASSQLSMVEVNINSSIEITTRAREITLQMMTGTASATDRQAGAIEVGHLIQHLNTIMNSSNTQGELLFAGNNVNNNSAFVTDSANSTTLQTGNQFFAYIGSANAGADYDPRANFGARSVQIGFATDNRISVNDNLNPSRIKITDPGNDVFGITNSTSLPAGVDSSLINVLVQLKDYLDQGLPPAGGIGVDLIKSIQNMSVQLAEVGSRQNRIESQYDAGRTLSIALEGRRSQIEDQDIVSGISQLTKSQVALQMSQQIFAKVQQMSLFNYLN